jgi:hypothetical protein
MTPRASHVPMSPFLRRARTGALGALLYASLASISIACGSGDNAAVDAGGSSDASNHDATAPNPASDAGDAGNPTDGSTPGDSGDAAAAMAPDGSVGVVSFTDYRQETTPYGSILSASFFLPSQVNEGCSVTSTGPCKISTCAPPGIESFPYAGTLTFSGGPYGDAGIAVKSSGPSYEYNANPLAFADNDSLSVSASGGDVPAFGPQTIVGPGFTTLTDPPELGGTIIVSTSQDLHVAWTGGETNAFEDVLFFAQTTMTQIEVECTFDATLGQGTIPKAALAPLASGLPGTDSFKTAQYRTITFTSGPFTITLQAETLTGVNSATFH